MSKEEIQAIPDYICLFCKGVVCNTEARDECEKDPAGDCPGGQGPDSCTLSPYFICECGT